MTTGIRLALLFLAFVILLGVGAWYYLFGPSSVLAASLVPSDTLLFATIPNAAEIVTDFQSSHLRQFVDSPDSKPLLGLLGNKIGQKNLDLLQTFLPNLSGQSFIAITHFDPKNWGKTGLIAGLKPKPGAGNFKEFIEQVKAAYPDTIAQGKTGTGQVEGLDYQWIQGPGASDKICVAQARGWIVTAWGEDSLRDWWERLQKKAATPSLAQNPGYQKSLDRIGRNSEAVTYVDYHAAIGLLQNRLATINPQQSAYLARKWQSIGAAVVGTRFEQGDIADHFSVLMPLQARIDAGYNLGPCDFETLKFTGPDTRFYYASSFDAAQSWKALQEQNSQTPPANPMIAAWMTGLQNWARAENIDIQKNIIDAIGNEISLQVEWSPDGAYPEAGFFAKLAKPDDFKPTVAAILDTVRKDFRNMAVVNEIKSGGQTFATLKFIQSLPVSPTVTEDGPYFGLFLTETHAVRSFQRDAGAGLLANPNFIRQIGNNRSGASQIMFIDSPVILDRAYRTALPYLSLAAMINPSFGAALHGQSLPPNLGWLSSAGTWSFVASVDDDGFKGYSISGLGNQGIYLAGGLGEAARLMHLVGNPAARISPTMAPPPTPPLIPATPVPAPVSAPAVSPAPPAVNAPTPPATNQ